MVSEPAKGYLLIKVRHLSSDRHRGGLEILAALAQGDINPL
jgi:hypothetical protein